MSVMNEFKDVTNIMSNLEHSFRYAASYHGCARYID